MASGPIDYPRAVLIVLAVVTLLALVVAGSTSSVAFGAYNAAWDGAADLRAQADAVGAEGTIVRNTSAYPVASANDTIAVVLSPDRPYGERESARLRRFVRAGGTLLVAEDFGPHTNGLLADIGGQARIDGRLVRDERYNYRAPALPVARNVSTHPLVAGVDELTLNHGTVLQPNGATVLVRTSGFAYLDANRDGALNDNETLGSFPVATVERVGAGRVIVVADPSLLINAMLERPGNRAFVRGLFDRHETVLLDYSHATGLPPFAVALLIVRETPLLQALLGIGAVATVAVWARRPEAIDRVRPIARSERPAVPGVDATTLREGIERRHPEWDRERLRRVVHGVLMKRDDRETEDDG